MSNLFSGLMNFITPDSTLAAHADLQAKQAQLAQLKLESEARSKMLGITDPYTGVNYGQPNQPLVGTQQHSNSQPPLMGNAQPSRGGLMGAPPQQGGAGQPDQNALYNQAFPEQAANMARVAPMLATLPPAERGLALLAPDKWAEARAKNIIEPDDAKLVDTLQSRIAALGGPTDPKAAPYVEMLTKTTQNLEPAKLAEDIRSHKATEAISGAQALGGATDVQPDPNNPGSFILINKLTGQTQRVGNGPVQLPPFGAPMPTTALPAGSGGPSNAPVAAPQQGTSAPQQSGAAIPQPSPVNDFTPQLSPEIQARVSMLPASNQGMVQAILTGRMAPPTGRILADPVMGPLFRQALQVDPSFDEAKWTARNKIVSGMADTSNASLGGKIDAAKKLINHTADLLDAAADQGNTHGSFVEGIGNRLTNSFGTGADINTLNRFKQAKSGVSAEYTKLMAGAPGGEGERTAEAENLSQDAPIPGTLGSVSTIMNQMRGQVDPLVDQYNGIMKTNVGTEQMLGTDAAQKLKAIQAITAAQNSGKNVTPKMIKETLAGQGLLSAGAAKSSATTPGLLPPPQDIVDELRRRGVVK